MSIIVLPRAETYRLVDLPELLSRGGHLEWNETDEARGRCARERQVWEDTLRDADSRNEINPMIAEFSPALPPGSALQERLLISRFALVRFLERRGIEVKFDAAVLDQGPQNPPQRGGVLPAESIQETADHRRERRYQMCIDAGLKMPNNPCARLPHGVGKLAKREGVKRQSFAQDVKAHIEWLHDKSRQVSCR